MKTLNDIHGATDAEIDSYLGDVSSVEFRRHVAEFGGQQRSLRDWFAGMALQGMVGPALVDAARQRVKPESVPPKLAEGAYAISDAMLAERKESK